MKISNFTTRRPNMAETRTFEDFFKMLGEKPYRLGVVANLYPQYTSTFLTEAIGNIFQLDLKKGSKFQSINSFVVEWDISVNVVKRVPFAANAVGTGANGSDITFYFNENHYQKHDVFTIDATRQQIIVITSPIRRSDDVWEVIGKIQDSSENAILDPSGVSVGKTTRFLTNFQPEISENGYTKYQSNVEKHRTFIGTHRVDIDYSAKYGANEEMFIEIGKGDGSDPVYKLDTAKKTLLDSFMYARNCATIFAKSNMDKNGKPRVFDEVGQPIISPDGIIPQVERFAGNFITDKLSPKIFNHMLEQLVARAEKPTGNTFTFIVNTIMYRNFQNAMGEWARAWKTNGAFIYSMGANKQTSLGTTFDSYTFGGNTIVITIDRALDLEFPDKQYGVFIDLTADSTTNKPALAMFTFKGGEIILNQILGVGGINGLTSGIVSSPVTASKLTAFGYAGVGVMNPYRSYVVKEA